MKDMMVPAVLLAMVLATGGMGWRWAGPARPRGGHGAIARWPASGDFPFELVVDARHPKALSFLLSLGTGRTAAYGTASLRPERSRGAAAGAVAVSVGGRQVGRLVGDEAGAYVRRLRELDLGTGDIRCDCVLRFLRRDDGLSATIQLDPDLRERPFRAQAAGGRPPGACS